MRGITAVLLCATTMLSTASAATVGRHVHRTKHAVPTQSASSRPKTAPPAKHVSVPSGEEAVMVSGARRTAHGSTQVVGRAMIENFIAGSSPGKILSQLPGVNFVSSDPIGMDAWGSSLYMRGFTQQQIGWSLDGVPLGAPDYRAYNGLPNQFAVISDNIATMDVSTGAGALSMPASNNLGGAIAIHTIDPAEKRGGMVSQTFGSNRLFRTFVRLDTGNLNSSGTRAFVSYQRSDGQKWKGSGFQFDQQVNAKLVQPIRNESRISLFFNWNQAVQLAYADETFAMVHALGTRNDYFWPNYKAAYLAAEGIYPSSYQNFSDASDVSYYDGFLIVNDYLGGANFDMALTKNLTWHTTLYGHGETQPEETWTTPYVPSPNGAPLSEQNIQTGTLRGGFTSSLDYTTGINTLEAGIWYEHTHYYNYEYQYAEPILGQGAPLDATSGKLGTPFQENWGMRYDTNTIQTHIQDTIRPTKGLTLNIGFRSLLESTIGGGVADDVAYNGQTNLPYGRLTSNNAFLPDFRADWHFFSNHEIYFDITKNMRGYSRSGYQLGSAWGVSNQQTFAALQRVIKPETDWVYDLGYRYNGHVIAGALNLYRANFSNRLQSLTSGTILQPISNVLNVGSVTMNGFDATGIVRPVHGLSISNTVSYNHAVYDNDISSEGSSYALRGKQIVNYPRWMYKANATYTYRKASVHLDASYTGRRDFSYVGDYKVPSFWLVNLGARYDLGSFGFMKNLTLDFNAYNLLNAHYIGQMGENGNPLTGDFQSIQAGAPRQYYGTISAHF